MIDTRGREKQQMKIDKGLYAKATQQQFYVADMYLNKQW